MDPFEQAEQEAPPAADPFAEAEQGTAATDPFEEAERTKPQVDPFAVAEQAAVPGSSPQQPSGAGYSKRVEDYSELESAGLGAVQGVAFDFADEIEAAVRSLGPGQTYDDALAKVRARYDAAQKANPKSYLSGQVSGAIATSFVPGLGALNVGKGAKLAEVAAKGALQGGLSGLGAAEDKFSAEGLASTAIGATGGAVLGSAVHGLGKAIGSALGGKAAAEAGEAIAKTVPEEVGPNLSKAIEEAYTPELIQYNEQFGAKLYDGTADILKEMTEAAEGKTAAEIRKANPMVENIQEFAGYVRNNRLDQPLSFDEAKIALNDARMQLSSEDFLEKYHFFSKAKLGQEVADATFGAESVVATGWRAATNAIVDNSYVAKDVDRRIGTAIEPLFMKATEADNIAKGQAAKFAKVGEEAIDGVTNSSGIIDVIEGRAKASTLSPADQAAVPKVQALWKDIANYLKDAGVPLQEIENYVKVKTVQPAEAMYRIGKKIDEAGGLPNVAKEFQAYTANKGTKLSPAMTDLVKSVSYLTGEVPKTGREFAKVVDALTKVGGSEAYAKQRIASALFQRGEGIPDFLREKDLGRLLNASIVDATRYATNRKIVAGLQYQRSLLKSAGDEKAVAWLDKTIHNYLGGTDGFAKLTQQTMQNLQLIGLRKLETANNPASKSFYTMLAHNPDKLSQVFNNVYANYLSTPKAIVQNLSSVIFQTIPELGYTYGSKNLLGAFTSALKKIRTDPKYLAGLEERGIIAPAYNKSELGRTIKTSGIDKFMDKASDFILTPFSYSEKIGRATLHELSNRLVDDRASASAQSFFKTMAPNTLRQFNALQGDEAKQFMNRYVQNRIMFSYNKINQAELARDAGPMLAMFTKYPTAVVGRAMDRYRAEGLKAGAKDSLKYFLVPYVAALTLDQGLEETAPDLKQTLFGRGGVAGASSVNTLAGIAEGKPFKAPAVGLVTDTATGLLSQDPNKLANVAKTVVTGLSPGGAGGYYRILEKGLELGGLIDEASK